MIELLGPSRWPADADDSDLGPDRAEDLGIDL
jgi:hypothetical protein